MEDPRLPPVFRPVPLATGTPLHAAMERAEHGAEAGTLVWTPAPDRLDCAVVIEPDLPLERTRPAVLVALLALADALVSAGPPRADVRAVWPDRITVNGAVAGGVRFAAPMDGGIPAWAVVAVFVDVLGDPDDDSPGRHPDRTALREEGFGEVDAATLLEGFARHLLSWMDAWENDGFTRVREAWARYGAELDETGALLNADGRHDLEEALRSTPWTAAKA